MTDLLDRITAKLDDEDRQARLDVARGRVDETRHLELSGWRAVLLLHRPSDFSYCVVCDEPRPVGDRSPCLTVMAIAAAWGVEP